MLEPLCVHRGDPESHHPTQDRVTVSPSGGPQFTEETLQPIISALMRREVDDEKTW